MNNIRLNIWGRVFELNIEYDCYSDEKILQTQRDAINSFVNNQNIIQDCLNDVKQYCQNRNTEKTELKDIENIFKFVVPKYIYIKRNEEKRIVALMCNYKFDIENGIAIVFENEKLKDIGIQDIIL